MNGDVLMAPLFSLVALVASQPLPAEREVSVPGFNGQSLPASVIGAQGHGHFAVLVAGSGSMDRDWSSPLLRRPSHSGRDLARWLQAQGLGSLRYDKRLVRAKAGMDLSLDAQLGDLKAALAFARSLPEAQGKKLLLVGHGEGSLLSLLAAGQADALLLLALPDRSLAAMLRDQVVRQLAQAGAPEPDRRRNLAYLEAALEAIRFRRDLPPPEAGVAPGLVALAKGLAAPATLDFVRQTLDLDPWAMVARCPQPMLLAWGDRDAQTPPPAEFPRDLKAPTLLLPGANHLLRREDRDPAVLNTATAMDRYGDDTPLADLGPLSAWVRGLNQGR